MTEPKEQAVPVVGVGEAVEALSGALAFGKLDAAWVAGLGQCSYGHLRTILQALQGSSGLGSFRPSGSIPIEGHGAAVLGLKAALFECQDKLWVARCDSRDEGFRRCAERAVNMASDAMDAAADLFKAIGQQASSSEAEQVGTSGASEPNTLPTVQAETAVVGELKPDFLRRLPGGGLDDAAYEAIEDALDRIEAPMQSPDGRWLKLHERISAIGHHPPVSTGEQPGMSEGGGKAESDPVDWHLLCFACCGYHPEDGHAPGCERATYPPRQGGPASRWGAARNLFITYAGRFTTATRYEEASAVADDAARKIEDLFDHAAPTLPDDLLSLSEAATQGPFVWSGGQLLADRKDHSDTVLVVHDPVFQPSEADQALIVASVNFIRTLAARQNRAGETT